jgi:hypothetical protein
MQLTPCIAVHEKEKHDDDDDEEECKSIMTNESSKFSKTNIVKWRYKSNNIIVMSTQHFFFFFVSSIDSFSFGSAQTIYLYIK